MCIAHETFSLLVPILIKTNGLCVVCFHDSRSVFFFMQTCRDPNLGIVPAV